MAKRRLPSTIWPVNFRAYGQWPVAPSMIPVKFKVLNQSCQRIHRPTFLFAGSGLPDLGKVTSRLASGGGAVRPFFSDWGSSAGCFVTGTAARVPFSASSWRARALMMGRVEGAREKRRYAVGKSRWVRGNDTMRRKVWRANPRLGRAENLPCITYRENDPEALLLQLLGLVTGGRCCSNLRCVSASS